MALVPVDSTNFVVGTNAVSTVSFGAGFRYLEVVNLDGGGHVGYRFDTTTNMSAGSALGGDNWYVAKAAGASRAHELVAADSSAPAFYVELVASNSVALTGITAWR